MNIHVQYTAQIRAALGTATERVELESAGTLRDLMERLADEHGDVFSNLVWDRQRGLQPSVLVCVGDQQIEPDMSRPLEDGDEVTLLSAISGG